MRKINRIQWLILIEARINEFLFTRHRVDVTVGQCHVLRIRPEDQVLRLAVLGRVVDEVSEEATWGGDVVLFQPVVRIVGLLRARPDGLDTDHPIALQGHIEARRLLCLASVELARVAGLPLGQEAS